MADLEQVQGKVVLSGDTSGADQATQSVNSFSSSLRNLSEVAAGVGLERLGEEFVNFTKDSINEVAAFQTNMSAIGTVLSNVGNGPTVNMDELIGGGGGKASSIANRMQDEMIAYKEKMTKIQDDIADVMKGQNVIDATAQMNQRLDDLEDNHVKKMQSYQQAIIDAQDNVTQNAAQRAQSEKDSLQDLQDSHDNKMLDKKEKHEQQMGDAANSVQRMFLQKKYDEEVTLENDSYQRSYDLKKKQIDRNNQEAADRDKAAAAKKIKTVNDEIAAENTSYDEQKAKLIKDSDDRIQKMKEENDKKLAQYKQSLEDEERLHKHHIEQMQEEAKRAGSAASNSFTEGLKAGDPFKIFKHSLENEMQFINDLSIKSPFNLVDINESDRLITSMGFNAQKLLPIFEDISAGTGKGLGVTTQAALDAVNGRLQMLQMSLGISKETLINFGAEFDKQGHLLNQKSLFEALQKMTQDGGPFSGATANRLHTFSGALSNVQDGLFKVQAGVLGLDNASGKVQKGSPFYMLTEGIVSFGEYLNTNKGGIVKTLSDVINSVLLLAAVITLSLLPALTKATVEGVAKLWIAYGELVVRGWVWLAQMALQVIGIEGLTLAQAGQLIMTEALTIATSALDIAIAILTAPITLVILAILGLILIGYELITHWNVLGKMGAQAWNSLANSIKSAINSVIPFINMLIDGINKVTFGKLNLQHIKPMALSGDTLTGANFSADMANFSMNPLEKMVSGLLSQGGSSPTAADKKSISSNPQGLGGNINITNINNIKNTSDMNALAKQMGLQVSLAR